jgi:hypothetical protein
VGEPLPTLDPNVLACFAQGTPARLKSLLGGVGKLPVSMAAKLKRNAMLAVAVLALAAGATVVATRGSGSKPKPAASTTASGGERGGGALAIAARYLGLSRAQLRAQLRTQRTLAAVANTTAGRSERGLIEALVNARTAALKTAVASGTAGASKLSLRMARLRALVASEVDRPRGAVLAAGSLTSAVSYLGLSRKQIRSQQRAGRSLAQIADATQGKSARGLIEALLAARRKALAAAVAAGTLSAAQETGALARLRQQVNAEVQRVPGKRSAASP